MANRDNESKFIAWVYAEAKWWQFWMPGSGLPGISIICAVVVALIWAF